MISINLSSGSGSDDAPYPFVVEPRGVPVEEAVLRARPAFPFSGVSDGFRPSGPSTDGEPRLEEGDADRVVPAADVRVDDPVGTLALSS